MSHQFEAGFYWVRFRPYEGKQQPPTIAEFVPECQNEGRWYICGIDAPFEKPVEILSPKLEIPT